MKGKQIIALGMAGILTFGTAAMHVRAAAPHEGKQAHYQWNHRSHKSAYSDLASNDGHDLFAKSRCP